MFHAIDWPDKMFLNGCQGPYWLSDTDLHHLRIKIADPVGDVNIANYGRLMCGTPDNRSIRRYSMKKRTEKFTRLVKAAQGGCCSSVDELARVSLKQLDRYFYHKGYSANLRDDLVQETVMNAFKNLGQLENPASYWSWVYRIAANVRHSYHRRQHTRPQVILSDLPDGMHSEFESHQISGEHLAVAREDNQGVKQMIAGLKENQLKIISKHLMDTIDYEALSKELDCSRGAARMMVHRARKKLKDMFLKKGFTVA